uniref:transposase n=1 Tax=Actinacidiphila oryziradicis TaxID=2571141 RepID=UPI002B0034B5|nr:transposase [Actinacidiphila oryziradicis]
MPGHRHRPFPSPRTRREDHQDRAHRRFRKRRAVAEHTLARLKDHQILRQCRRKGDGIDHAIAGIAALHNLKLEVAA